MGPFQRVPSRMVELLCLGSRGGINVFDPWEHDRSDVWTQPSRLRSEAVARVCRLHHRHLDGMLDCVLLQPSHAVRQPGWYLLHYRRLLHHDHRPSGHAWS